MGISLQVHRQEGLDRAQFLKREKTDWTSHSL